MFILHLLPVVVVVDVDRQLSPFGLINVHISLHRLHWHIKVKIDWERDFPSSFVVGFKDPRMLIIVLVGMCICDEWMNERSENVDTKIFWNTHVCDDVDFWCVNNLFANFAAAAIKWVIYSCTWSLKSFLLRSYKHHCFMNPSFVPIFMLA